MIPADPVLEVCERRFVEYRERARDARTWGDYLRLAVELNSERERLRVDVRHARREVAWWQRWDLASTPAQVAYWERRASECARLRDECTDYLRAWEAEKRAEFAAARRWTRELEEGRCSR